MAGTSSARGPGRRSAPIGVVMNDSHGRARPDGAVGVCIGAAGLGRPARSFAARPIVLCRGLATTGPAGRARDLVRPRHLDMFR